jgi:tetratricopeptide (TPR) repeat protein
MANGTDTPTSRATASRGGRTAANRLRELELSIKSASASSARHLPGGPTDPVHCFTAPEQRPLPARKRVFYLADRLMEGLAAAYQRFTRVMEGTTPAIGTDPSAIAAGPNAITSLTRMLAIQPHNCLAWFHLGMVYLEQEAYKEAVSAFERARSFGYDTYELHFYLAEALAALQRHEEAVEELYNAMDRQPDAAEPAYRLGISLAESGRLEEAVAAFKIAVSLSPNTVRYHQSLGLTLESLGQRDEAIRCFKAAVNIERRAG